MNQENDTHESDLQQSFPQNMVHCVHRARDLVTAYVEHAWQAIWPDCRCHKKGSSGHETIDALWRQLHHEGFALGLKTLGTSPSAINRSSRAGATRSLGGAGAAEPSEDPAETPKTNGPPDEWAGVAASPREKRTLLWNMFFNTNSIVLQFLWTCNPKLGSI